MMIKVFGFVVAGLLFAGTIEAQVATPASKLGWNQEGQTQAIAQSATYNMYVDVLVPTVAQNVICIVGTPVTCKADLPALTVGSHQIRLTQVIGAAESPQSLPLSFTYVVVVTPTGLILTSDD